jgi:hypothetical protein
MSADAIFRVTQALKVRLQQALAAAGDPGAVFIGPLDDPDAQGASLILFLYRIALNASLRNLDHLVPSDSPPPPVLDLTNSLPLELHFLLTVGTRPGSGEEPLLKTLGLAMRALNLETELSGPAVSHETINISFEPLSTEETSRIWTLFPTTNYRTSIGYVASPVWIDPPQPAVPAARVLQDGLRGGPDAREVENV